jgi:two-component system chemotaxis response regulator CheY
MALEPDGYEIDTASNGRHAIDIGTRFRPDVVVTDWMLRNHIHGLHVVESLRAFNPGTRSILITGFASDDLREDASKLQVVDFIEKPFKRDRIRQAVRQAIETAPSPPEGPLPGMIEVDRAGRILFANPAAKEFVGEAQSLEELFGAHEPPELDEAQNHWIAATPQGDKSAVWYLRSQRPRGAGTRLVALKRRDDPHTMGEAIIEMLLDFTEAHPSRWPFEGRVMVVDDEILLRRLFVSMLEASGAGCYGVESSAEAVRLLETDDGVKYLIHDFDMPNTDISESIDKIRTVRPDVTIIGTSGSYRKEDFATLGVEHFLQKPWRVTDLVNALHGRIGNCIECGLALPLRQPRPGEQARRWVCAFCRSPYSAVLDEAFPKEVIANARPEE